MSYIVTELEEDVLMELNHKQTQQIHGGSEESFDVDLSGELGHQFAEVMEKYKHNDCIVISLDLTKLNEPWSVDHYICYREADELPDYIKINTGSVSK